MTAADVDRWEWGEDQYESVLNKIGKPQKRNAEGKVHITMTNTSLKENAEVTIDLGLDGKTAITGEILTSADIHDCNTFENPETVRPVAFDGYKIKNGKLIVKLPAKSIVALAL